MCVDTCPDMCIDKRMGICTDMCVYMCLDMCPMQNDAINGLEALKHRSVKHSIEPFVEPSIEPSKSHRDSWRKRGSTKTTEAYPFARPTFAAFRPPHFRCLSAIVHPPAAYRPTHVAGPAARIVWKCCRAVLRRKGCRVVLRRKGCRAVLQGSIAGQCCRAVLQGSVDKEVLQGSVAGQC